MSMGNYLTSLNLSLLLWKTKTIITTPQRGYEVMQIIQYLAHSRHLTKLRFPLSHEYGGEWIHTYVWLNPFAVYLKLSQHC